MMVCQSSTAEIRYFPEFAFVCQSVHRSMGIGLLLELLIINAIIGGYLRKMRWSITFYETQTKQSDIFSIFSVL